MNSSTLIQSQVDSLAWVVSKERPLSKVILTNIQTLHFRGVLIDPTLPLEAQAAMQLTQAPDVVIWLHSPGESSKETKVLRAQLSAHLSSQALILHVGFDHMKTSLEAMLQEGEYGVGYFDVIEPRFPSMSAVQDASVLSFFQQRIEAQKEKMFPLWYEDCADHLLSLLLRPPKTIELYRGVYEVQALVFIRFLSGLIAEKPIDLSLLSSAKHHSGTLHIGTRDPALICSALSEQGYFKAVRTSIEQTIEQRLKKPKGSKSGQIEVYRPEEQLATIARKKRRIQILRGLFFLVLSVSLGCLVYMGVFIVSLQQLRKEAVYLFKGEARTAQRVQNSVNRLEFYKQSPLSPLAFSGFSLSSNLFFKALLTADLLFEGVENLDVVGDDVRKGLAYALGTKDGEVFNSEEASQLLTQSSTALARVSSRLSTEGQALSLLLHTSTSSDIEGYVREKRRTIALLSTLSDLVPRLTSGEKTYVVALEDSTQLRASGGVVPAIAVLSFQEGVLRETQVYTAQEIMDSIPGEVSVPEEISSFSSLSKEWRLEDAGWIGPFPRAAQQIAWFVSRSQSKSIDGVVAIPLMTLEKIMTTMGIIDLGDQTISSTSLFEYMSIKGDKQERYARVLAVVLPTIFQHLADPSSGTGDDVLAALTSSQLGVWFSDPSTQALLASTWTGDISPPGCPSVFGSGTECATTSVGMIENSVNFGEELLVSAQTVSRSTHHRVSIVSDQTLHQRDVELSLPTQVATASYSAILSLILPGNAVVSNVSIDGQSQSPTKLFFTKKDHSVYVGVRVNVTGGGKTQARFVYTTPPVSSTASFVFAEYKQPGIGDENFSLELNYPQGYFLRKVAPRPEKTGTSVLFSGMKTENALYAFQFDSQE